MEKHIGRWSYWLGIACLVIALGWRGVNALGLLVPPSAAPARTISYWSFYHGSFLFLAASIASTCYVWLNEQKT
jgi:hypothetical protein